MEAEIIIREGSICVELFRNAETTFEKAKQEGEKAQLLAKQKAAQIRQKNEKMEAEYQELDLNGQVKLLNKEAEIAEKEAKEKAHITPEKLGYKKITPVQMIVWKGYLPTEYKDDNLKEYSFDLIPMAVITEWETARLFELFTDFSIRTPEGKSILKRMKEHLYDPILIGWFEGSPYLISRWGESLKTFSEIKARVLIRRVLEPTATTLLGGLWLCIGICLVYFCRLTGIWWSILHVGYWLFFTAFLGQFLPAVWRELYFYLELDAPVSPKNDPLQKNLFFGFLVLCSLNGLAVCIYAIIAGSALNIYWVISSVVLTGEICWIGREIARS